MKTKRLKSVLLNVVLLVTLLGSMLPVAMPATRVAAAGEVPVTVSFIPDTFPVAPGSNNLTARINIGQVNNLGSAMFDVFFDVGVLQFVQASNGSIGGAAITVTGATSIGPGALRISSVATGSPLSGTGYLADLTFSVQQNFSGGIGLSNGALKDGAQNIIPSTFTGDKLLVNAKMPLSAYQGFRFLALVNIEQVSGFDASDFEVSYDPTKLELKKVADGLIGATNVPVEMVNFQFYTGTSEFNPSRAKVIVNVPGIPGVDGAGYLAVLHFKAIGTGVTNIKLVNGTLSNNLAQPIQPAMWAGLPVNLLATPPPNGVSIEGNPDTYPTIQDAVNVTVPGDTIIINTGTYAAFSITGKRDITVQGAGGATVNNSPVLVPPEAPKFMALANVKDSKGIEIQGLNFDGSTLPPPPGPSPLGIRYHNSQGWIANLTASNFRGDIASAIQAFGDVDGATNANIYNVTTNNSSAGIVANNASAIIDSSNINGTRPGIDRGVIAFDNANVTINVSTIKDFWTDAQGNGGIGVMAGFPDLSQENTKFGHVERASTVVISGSTIRDNNIGVLVDETANVTVHSIGTNPIIGNNITGNDIFGVGKNIPAAGTTVDATNNWWGHASGPAHPSNPAGTGNPVTDRVNFSPWLDGPYPGGQPVTGGGVVTLEVTGLTNPVVAGTPSNVIVTAKEGANVKTDYVGTITFTSNDPLAIAGNGLPANYTFLAADNGTKTFIGIGGVTLKTAGTRTVTATDTGNAATTGTSANITVNPAGAVILVVSEIADSITKNVASDVTVTAKDVFGNTATGYTGTIHFTSSDTDAGVVLPADYTFDAGDTGTHEFAGGVKLQTVGEQTVTATDTGTPAITGSQTAITVILPPEGFTVAGTVKEVGSSNTIAGAIVNLHNTVTGVDYGAAPTVADGLFSIDVPGGTYNVTAVKTGYITYQETGLVVSDNMSSKLIMLATGLTVSGIIRNAQEQPIQGANASLTDSTTFTFYASSGPSAADGSYSITVPPTGGTYILDADKAGYVHYQEADVVVNNNISNKDIALESGFTVSGVVKDAGTQALLSGADVWLYDTVTQISYGGLPTGPSGAYSITVPAGNNYQLKATKTGFDGYEEGKSVIADMPNQTILMQPQQAQAGALHHFEFNVIGNQTAGAPFSVTITAKDAGNVTVATYTGSNSLNDTTGTISPKQTANFNQGVWTGNVTIMKPRQGDVITTQGGGVGGSSNLFDVAGFRIENLKNTFMLPAGGSEQANFDVVPVGGFAGMVNLSLHGPPGIEASSSITPNSVVLGGSAQATLNLIIGVQVPAGTYQVRIEGASGNLRAEVFINVNVGMAGQPLLTAQPGVVILGGNTVFSVSQFPAGSPVEIRWDNGPLAGTQNAVLATSPAPIDQSGMWTSPPVTIDAPMTAGTFMVKAISGTAQAFFTLVIIGSGGGADFVLNLSPNFLSVSPGGDANATIGVQSVNSFSSEVTFSIWGPPGIILTPSPSSVTPFPDGQVSATLNVAVDDWVGPGMYYVGIDASGGDPQIYKHIDLNVNVMPPSTWGASISLSQTYGKAGDVVTISGFNFTRPAGTPVTIREVFSGTVINTIPAAITLAEGGVFTAQITVPNVPEGFYKIEAVADGERAEAGFQVLGSGASFNASVTPQSISVITEAGKNSGTVNINLFSMGSSSTIGLSMMSAHPWLTYKFGSLANNTPATGANAINIPAGGSQSVNLALTASLSAPVGNWFVNIMAESGGVSQFMDIELIVMPPASFGMAGIGLNPASGAAGTVVQVNGWGFTAGSTVSDFMFAGVDVKAGRTINISSSGSFSTNFTVPSQVWGAAIAPGMYPVDVVDSAGMWGGMQFNVVGAGQKFTLQANPAFLPPIVPGQSGTTMIKVQSMGEAVTVNLAVENLYVPMGAVLATFSSASVAVPPGGYLNSTLTLTPNTFVPPGHYSGDVKGTDSANPATFTYTRFEYDVKPPSGFSFPEIALNPNAGPPGTKVTISGTDFPSGTTVTGLKFGPQALTLPIPAPVADSNGGFTFLFNVPQVPSGVYPVDLQAGTIFISKPFVVATSDVTFTLFADPPYIPPIEAGQSGTTMIRVKSMGPSVTVELTALNLPPGVGASFSPSTVDVPPGGSSSSTLTISPSATAMPGHYFADIKGAMGAAEFFTHIEYDVLLPANRTWMQDQGLWFPDITLNPNMGKAGTMVTVMGSNYPPDANITGLWFAGQPQTLPAGLKTSATGSFTLVFTAPTILWGGPTAPGWYPVDVEAGGQFRSKPFEVTGADAVFTINAEPNWLPSILPGQSATTTIRVQSMGAATTVDLSAQYFPPGVTTGFAPASVSVPAGGTGTSTLTVTPNLLPGHYALDVKGVSGAAEAWTHIEFDMMSPTTFMDNTWMQSSGVWFPEITLNPNIGPAGTKVTVIGTKFPPEADINALNFGGAPQPIPPGTKADLNGGFTLVFNVPTQMWGAPTGWGWYPVEVGGSKTGFPAAFAMKDFQVTSGDAAFVMNAEPQWLPATPPGTPVSTTIRIKSLKGALTVNLSAQNFPPGAATAFSPASVSVPAGGSGTSTLTITPSAVLPPGHYVGDVKGVAGTAEFFAHIEFDMMSPTTFMDNTWMKAQGVWYPEIMLNPNIGPVGTKVTVVGTSFPPSVDITHLRFGGAEQPLPAGTKSDASGGFTLVFNVPSQIWGAPTGGGWYGVEVETAAQSGYPPAFVMKDFQVTAGDLVFTMKADPDWLPPTPPGTPVTTTIRIKSMKGELTVNLSAQNFPPGVTTAFSPASVNVPAGGSGTSTLTITPNMPPGQYGLDVKGVSGAAEFFANVGFNVMPPTTFMDNTWMRDQGVWFPEITLNPNIGPVGTKVTVIGTKFPPEADITALRFGGADQPLPTGTKADASGGFTMVFNVPSQIWGGPTGWGWYPVDVEASKIGFPPAFVSKPFQVTAGDAAFIMSAEPEWLPSTPPGTPVTTTIRIKSLKGAVTVNLSAQNFPPGVTTAFNPASVNVPAGGSGTSTLTITPNMPPGHYFGDIKGVSGAAEFFAHVEYDVMPSATFTDKTWMQDSGMWFPEITLNPSSGAAGRKVTIMGSDFPANAPVTGLWFAGESQPVPPNTNADVDGDFTLVFNVPQTLGGQPIQMGMYPVDVQTGGEGVPPVFITKWFEVTSGTQTSFNIWASPDWLPGIAQGSSGDTSVFVEATGGQVTVDLSVDGLPFGATAQFSPSASVTVPPGGKKSVKLTISTNASTPPGPYPLSIKGVSGANIRMVNFGFNVMMGASYSIPQLTLNPDFAPAGYGDKKIKIGFNGTGFPANQSVTVKFAGNPVTLPPDFKTDGSGKFNGVFQLPSGLGGGTYMVEASAGGKMDGKPFTIKASGSTFILAASPPFLPPILQGGSGVATVNVTSVATTSATVTLSVEGLPAGVTANFASNPVEVSPGASASTGLTINVGAGTLPGPYGIALKGTSGSEVVTFPFGFAVMPNIGGGKGHASVTINPPSGTPGSNITIAGAGFTNGATVTLEAGPEGAAAFIDITPGTITVQNDGTWSAQMTVPPAAQVPPGVYRVKATDGTVSAATKFHILPATDATLTLDLSPSYLKVTQGQSGDVTLKVSSANSFNSVLNFGVGGLPIGVTVTFSVKGSVVGKYQGTATGEVKVITEPVNVTPVPGQTIAAKVLVEVDAASPLGPSGIPLEVSYNPTMVSLLNLMVVPAGANLIISPDSGTAGTDISLSGSGFTGGETITVKFGDSAISTIPAAVTAAENGTFTAVITAPSVKAGVYPIKTTGGTSGTWAKAPFKLKPSSVDTFILSAKPAQLSIPKGGSSTFNLSVEPSGSFNSEVTLTLSGLNAITGATSQFVPSSGKVTPSIGTSVSASLEITIPSGATEGKYPVTVTGVGGGVTRAVDLIVKVIPAAGNPDFSISTAPDSVTLADVNGQTGTTAVAITALNQFSGAVDLALSALPAGVTSDLGSPSSVTPSVSTGTGAKTITFTLSDANAAQPGSTKVTITGSSGTTNHSVDVTLVIVASGSQTTRTESSLVDSSTVSDVTPLTLATASGDVIQVNAIVPEVQQPISIFSEETDSAPSAIGGIPVNWEAARNFVTNVGTSSSISAVGWQFMMNYDPAALAVAGINASRLNAAYLNSATGQWVVENSGVTLRLVPSASSIAENTDFTVDVNVEAGEQTVSGAAIYLDFDPTKMEVKTGGIVAGAGTPLTQALSNSFDNTAGQLSYSAGAPLGGPSGTGTFTVATITFKGKAASSTMLITFSSSGGRITDVVDGGSSVLGRMFDTARHVTMMNLNHMSTWTLLGESTTIQTLIRLVPSSGSVSFGTTFTVDIQLETGDQQISGVESYVDFNKDVLEVLSVEANPDSGLPTSFKNTFNNSTGRIDFSVGAALSGEPPPPNGTFVIATVTFRAKAVAESSPITFSTGPQPRVTDAVWGGGSVLSAMVNTAITVVYDVPLKLQPASPTGVENQEFNIELWSDVAEGQSVDSIAAYLNFNKDYLEGVSITVNEALLNNVTTSAFDNDLGQVNFAATATGTAPSGSFKIATIRFRGKAKVTATPVTFSLTDPRKSAVSYQSTLIGGARTEASVKIIAPALNGTLTLQGDSRPYAGYDIPLTVKLYSSAVTNVNIKTLEPAYTFSTADGTINITGRPTEAEVIAGSNKTITFVVTQAITGTYNITVYSPHAVVNLKNGVVLTEAGVLVDFGTLREGDAQDLSAGSVVIDFTDFVAFGNAYETQSGMANWNANADFDRNGWVKIADFGLLYTNYGKTSPQTVP